MRIAVCGFVHETNMFGSVKVDMDLLQRSTREGEVLRKCFSGSHSYVGGYFDEAAELGVEIVPIRLTSLKPSGPCVPEGVDLCRERTVELLKQAWQEQPFDGIAMFMHGASAAEGHPDIEGEFLEAIRETLGYDIPIGMALDLHGNITPEMIKLSDLLIGCKEYPHVDEYERGRVMFRILCDMIKNNYRPAKALVKLPWHMVPAQGCTLNGPGKDVLELLVKTEQEDPDMLQASFFQGFPYTDVPSCSVSVVVMAKTQESADKNARRIAQYAWDKRRDFDVPIYSAEQAVSLALEQPESPVLIHESSDNPGGGTPGDGTFLLRELLRRDVPAAISFIYDSEVAQQAVSAGVGATIDCCLGGKSDRFHGEPIEIKGAYIKSICDGCFSRISPMGYGRMMDIGMTVCLVVGNVEIVVGGGAKNGILMPRTQTFDEGPFRITGVDWQHKKIVALKSAQHFKGWWGNQVKTMISCESPGLTSADLDSFNFNNIDRNYYPFRDARWEE